jgi:hypothetical protein
MTDRFGFIERRQSKADGEILFVFQLDELGQFFELAAVERILGKPLVHPLG